VSFHQEIPVFLRTLIALVTLMLLCPSVFAKTKAVANPLEIDTYDNFQLQVVDIRGEMTVGGRYEFLKGKDRESVNQMLDAMAELLQASGSIMTMAAEAKSSLISDQQKVNELLTRFADNRVICKHEIPIGSLIPKKQCRTLRQIEKSRLGSNGQIMGIQRNSDLGRD
jgi:hypothetical protein